MSARGEYRRSGTPCLPPRARLTVQSGQYVGVRHAIQPPAMIGRDAGAGVVLDDPLVSRYHAEVDYDAATQRFSVRDLDSRNGTQVNGARIDEAVLEVGDRITIGGHAFVFSVLDPADDQLRRNQRLEALGRLAAEVAHDLNNMLGTILSTLEYVAGVEDDDVRQIRECLGDVSDAARRAAGLTPRLLAFARRERAGYRSVDVSLLCEELLRVAKRTFPHSISIDADITPSLFVYGDEGELYHALTNLLLDARDAVAEGGSIRVIVSLVPSDPANGVRSHVVIAITDSGRRFDAETVARIFEPLGSLNTPERRGTLALAIAREILEDHGGALAVANESDAPAGYTVLLPQLVATRDSELATDRPPPPLAGLTVLVADDEPGVLRGLGRMLRARGMLVVEACDGAEAVAMYKNGAVRPDLVMLDVGMPNIDGVEALRQIRAHDHGARVVLTTGRSDSTTLRELYAAGASEVLGKPYAMRDVMRAVATALEEEQEARGA